MHAVSPLSGSIARCYSPLAHAESNTAAVSDKSTQENGLDLHTYTAECCVTTYSDGVEGNLMWENGCFIL